MKLFFLQLSKLIYISMAPPGLVPRIQSTLKQQENLASYGL